MAKAEQFTPGYHDLFRREIFDLIPTSSKHILDLGCGTGELGKAVKRRQVCRYSGIEINKKAAGEAGEVLDRVWCDNLNRFDPNLYDIRYDCLIFGDILEHLISPWDVLKKFASVLTDDGVIIASIPDISHPWIISQLQKGLFRYEHAGILDITHLRFFTQTTMFQMFYQAGLKIINVQPHPSASNPVQRLIVAVKPKVEHSKPLVTILILAYNCWEYTSQCIQSIKNKTQFPYKILVIDNGSSDSTAANLRKDTSIYHIENRCNLGFARGFNIGLQLVNTPYFVLCNNDTVVTYNWLSQLVSNINLDDDLVCLGPMSNNVSGPQRVLSPGYENVQALDDYAANFFNSQGNEISAFQRIVFFFTLFKTKVLPACGLLDERYEIGNFEDDDYCMTIARSGLKSAIDHSVFIHHRQGATFKSHGLNFYKIMEENKQRFLKKWNLRNIEEYYSLLEGSKSGIVKGPDPSRL